MIARRANNLHFGFALAAITVFAMVASSNTFGQQKTEPGPAAWRLVFRVVDDDGVLLKNATIATRVNNVSDSHHQLPTVTF